MKIIGIPHTLSVIHAICFLKSIPTATDPLGQKYSAINAHRFWVQRVTMKDGIFSLVTITPFKSPRKMPITSITGIIPLPKRLTYSPEITQVAETIAPAPRSMPPVKMMKESPPARSISGEISVRRFCKL